MSAPLPTWIPSHRAMGVIARAMQTQRGFEPAVLEALVDGSIRSRRRIEYVEQLSSFTNGRSFGGSFRTEELEVTELAPEFWRVGQKAADPWGPWAAYSDDEIDPWAAYSDDEEDHTVTFEFHYADVREWLSPTKPKDGTRRRPFKSDREERKTIVAEKECGGWLIEIMKQPRSKLVPELQSEADEKFHGLGTRAFQRALLRAKNTKTTDPTWRKSGPPSRSS